MVRFMCPKCGGMYMKAGRCETCGFIVDAALAKQSVTPQPAPVQENAQPEYRNLMTCPDCGKLISKDALSCPQCGCPFPGNMKGLVPQNTPVQKKTGPGVLGIILGIVIGLLVFWYIAAPYSTPVWLQKIGGTIRCFFTGETSYKIFAPK